jgi:hypothetical protein
MKIRELFEDVADMVGIDDLFIYQDNVQADQRHINSLAAEMKGGEDIEPVLVAALTPKLRKELQRIRTMHDTEPQMASYKGTISDELLSTKKKFILLDGNHRYLAAKKAGIKKLPCEFITSADDVVSIMHSGEV